MILRTLLSLVNLAVIAATVFIWFELPAIANVALYALVGWMFATFVVMYSPWGNRRVTATSSGGSAPSGSPFAAPAPTSLPLASNPSSAPALDFCIFCAATLPAGSPRCPACGHPVPA